MTRDVADRGTLAVVAPEREGLEGGMVRARLFARSWGGRVVLIVLDGADEPSGSEDEVPVIAAAGDVADSLRPPLDAAWAAAGARALLDTARKHGPIARVVFVGGAETMPLLPVFSEAVFPASIDLDLRPTAEVPDGEWLWEHADGVMLNDEGRIYTLASGQPAVPVRVVPFGAASDVEQLEALRAAADLPALGGTARTSVIVPVRGHGDLVLRMADSVLERTGGLFELILIEDASPDRTLEKLERLAAQERRVRLLVNREQHGFAASCNRGLAAARGDVAIVLNADTVVTAGWAERLCAHLATAPKAGAVGPLSNRVSGLQQIAPVDYDERSLVGLQGFADRIARSNPGHASGVVRLTGLCMAISRPALRRIGGFDPRFFPGNFEDDDWSLRLIAGGLVPYRADDAFIHHEGSKSFALESVGYRALLEVNWTRFKAKWNLPADRPVERHYSPEELGLRSYERERHFIAPWRATEPVRDESKG